MFPFGERNTGNLCIVRYAKNVYMNHERSYLRAIFEQHAKPVIKQALTEWFAENHLSLLSTRPVQDNAYIDTDTALKLLGGINRHTLYKYIKEGLPAVKAGKGYKFKIEDISTFLKNKNSK